MPTILLFAIIYYVFIAYKSISLYFLYHNGIPIKMKLVGDGLFLNNLGTSGLIIPTLTAVKEGCQSLFKPDVDGVEISLTLILEGVTAGDPSVAQRSKGVLTLAKGVLGGCVMRYLCFFFILSSSSGVSCFIDITRH